MVANLLDDLLAADSERLGLAGPFGKGVHDCIVSKTCSQIRPRIRSLGEPGPERRDRSPVSCKPPTPLRDALPHVLTSPPRPSLASRLRVLGSRRAGLALILAFAAFAVLVGIVTPSLVPVDFLEEGGPVETLTMYLYVVAALAVAMTRLPSLTPLDKLAVFVLLLAFGAREADLHVALFDVSILKASFYRRQGTPGQIVLALAILLPVALSFLLLLKRHGSRWLSRPSRWQVQVVTVATFLVLMAVTKIFDRLPAASVELGLLEAMPAGPRHILLALEELLELALPLLAMLAVVQGRMEADDTAASRLPPNP